MTRSKAKANDLPKQPPADERRAAAWVESMQAHFQQTGYYRANDLNRLLGDPRDAVGITVDNGVQIHSLAAK